MIVAMAGYNDYYFEFFSVIVTTGPFWHGMSVPIVTIIIFCFSDNCWNIVCISRPGLYTCIERKYRKKENVMSGFITKKEVLSNLRIVWKLGGVRLIIRCLTARRNTPFLTILTEVTR